MSTTPEAHPTVKVARHLREIADELYPRLREQAINDANSALMPGGAAMVALGQVANLEAWENQQQATERWGRAYTSVADEDPDEAWSAYQLLEFWSEQWRREHGAEYDGHRTTIQTEANFIRSILDWAWDNEPAWDDFAADVRRARAHLEDVLSEGERAERGVPCLYSECDGKRLTRRLEPCRGEDGGKAWRWTDWHCPSCHRSWTDSSYAAMVSAEHWEAQQVTIGDDVWLSVHRAANEVGRSRSTIRQWVHKGHISQVCIIAGRRVGFVSRADVETRNAQAGRRKRVA